MASVGTDGPGRYRVTFDRDRKRHTVRLGRVPKKLAETVRMRVEALLAALAAGLPADVDTARWLAGVGDDLHAKLAAAGLTAPRQSERLGAFLDAYLARRAADAKGATVTNYRTVANDVRGFFGDATPLRDVTERRADDFRTHYLTRTPKLAAATVARRLKTVRAFFEHARRVKLVPANPFADVRAATVLPEASRHYVSVADAERLIAAANPVWRLMVALSRFAGLRCPSEVLSLKWEHVNFETGRMTVPSPKTEHLPGKAYRVVPIFPALRPVLAEAFELAADGAVYVVPGNYREQANKPGGWNNASLGGRFLKLIRRAGLTPWPRPWHNMRASCETDLMAAHPIHVACAWVGNTPAVALRHYVTVQERDFERAAGGTDSGTVLARNAARTGADRDGPEPTRSTQPTTGVRVGPLGSEVVRSGPDVQVGVEGLEPRLPPCKGGTLTAELNAPDQSASASRSRLANVRPVSSSRRTPAKSPASNRPANSPGSSASRPDRSAATAVRSVSSRSRRSITSIKKPGSCGGPLPAAGPPRSASRYSARRSGSRRAW